ncbi:MULTISPECIES: CPBP family intramembrane glutamic endopeptidase [Haloferax]|nr:MULTISPECIES: type II CAAX endopeptidase family protein [Haloferax]
MHWRSLLWTDGDRRTRTPVRVGVGFLLIALLAVVGTLVAELLAAAVWPDRPFAYVVVGSTVGLGIGAVIGIGAVARWVDRRPVAEYGMRGANAWWRDLVVGVALAVVVWVAVLVVELGADVVVIVDTFRAGPEGFVLALVASLILFGVASLSEELVFRGFVLKNIVEGLTGRGRALAAVVAVTVSSLLFGAVHLMNSGASLGSTISVALIAISLGAATVLTGRIGLAVGLHLGWNVALGVLLGYRVSGVEAPAQVLVLAGNGRGGAIWTGGAFGPEAGLLGILAGALVLLGVLGYARLTQGTLRIHPSLGITELRAENVNQPKAADGGVDTEVASDANFEAH